MFGSGAPVSKIFIFVLILFCLTFILAARGNSTLNICLRRTELPSEQAIIYKLNAIVMINLSFIVDNQIVETIVTKNIVKEYCVEYSVRIGDPKIASEIGSMVQFKKENGFISYKDQSGHLQGETANGFLLSFKRALAWQESQKV